MNNNEIDKEVKRRGRLLAEKFEQVGVLTFEDFDIAMEGLENQEEETVFICDKCGLEHEINYTQELLLKTILCSCGNETVVQIHRGNIIWKMQSNID